MTPADHEDRMRRLRQRGEVFFGDMGRVPLQHRQLLERAWEEALKVTDSALPGLGEATNAALKTSRLDAILSLLERITRPSHWLDAQALWFGWAQTCLVDAVMHAGSDAPLPPPILVVEPIDSPLYVPRTQVPGEWLAQATPANLPLPVVLCPGNVLEEPWAWATLFHELGHHLDQVREDTRHLLERLEIDEDRVDDLDPWLSERWVGEVIADLYAGLLGGPGAVETLKASLTTRHSSASHPSDADRARILDAAWKGLRDGQLPREDKSTELVARALVERFSPHWRSRVQRDCEQPEEPLDSARLLPGMLHRRHTAGMAPDALRAACRGAFESGQIHKPAWVLTPAHLDTLAGAMRNLVETRVQPGTGTLKVPPVELLVRHHRMSFVGATHGQLLPKLKEAMERRTRPYAHIELFALDDAPLQELTLGGKTGSALLDERETSLRQLHEYLTGQNVPHDLYIYTQPYFFASFWDVEPGVSRSHDAPPAHIHVSSALWDMDLRHAVGQDLEAPAGEPLPRAMKSRVEALEHLRRKSRRWA